MATHLAVFPIVLPEIAALNLASLIVQLHPLDQV